MENEITVLAEQKEPAPVVRGKAKTLRHDYRKHKKIRARMTKASKRINRKMR